ncbi:hypothetical protein G6F37_003083 [Rhizopus arrhizus]|nr:hypothetical protein G6F37_003083 [Rhizopus arrhizus]
MDHSMGHSMDHSNNSMDHSGHNMSNMTTGNSGSHMHHMMMGAMGTFHWSTTGDGIWINTWVPSSKGAYAGACFGMLFMTILYKGIPTLDAYLVAWRKTRESNICTIQSNIEQVL